MDNNKWKQSFFILLALFSFLVLFAVISSGQSTNKEEFGQNLDIVDTWSRWLNIEECSGCEKKAIGAYCGALGYEGGYIGECSSKSDNELNQEFNEWNVCCFKDNPEPTLDFSSLELRERSLYSNKYFDSQNGYFVAQLSQEPINFYDGEKYKPINPTIISEGCELDFCVKEGIYHAEFKEISESDNLVELSYEGSSISYEPKALSYMGDSGETQISLKNPVEGVTEGNIITYPQIFGPGIDISYEYGSTVLKENIIIADRSNLPTLENSENQYLKFNFEFRTTTETVDEGQNYIGNKIIDSLQDLEWDQKSKLKVNGPIDIKDQDDNLKFRILKPFAIDNGDNEISLEYGLEEIDGKLYISVLTPYGWLEEASYPVRIDPPTEVTKNISGFTSNYVDHDWWDNDVDGNNDGSHLYDIASDKLTNGERCTYGLAEFHIKSEIPNGSEILDTDMYLYVNEVNDNDCNADVDIDLWGYYEHSLPDYSPNTLSELNQDLNYIASENIYFGELSNLDDPDDETWVHEDLDAGGDNLAQSILDGSDPTEDFGMWLMGTCWAVGGQGNDCHASFDGELAALNRRPQLVVTYTAPCTIPDGSSYQFNCDCNNHNDCPSGYTCEQRDGPDACILVQQCSGQIAVIVEDSLGRPIEDSYVYLNSNSNGQTDSFGYKGLTLNSVTCGSPQNVQVRCEDNIEICGNKSTSMDNPNANDYDSLYFTCDMCLPESDLLIDKENIRFADQGSQTNVSILVDTVNVEASNVDVRIIKACTTGYSSQTKTIPTVTSSNSYSVSTVLNLDDCTNIIAIVDPDNEITEVNEENNIAEQFVIDPVKIFLNVDTGFSLVDDEVEEFISDFARSTNSSQAQLEIYVGRNLAPDFDQQTGWGMHFNHIKYGDQLEGIPYNGIIGKKFDGVGGKPRLYVFGNEIEGAIAAVKELVKQRHIFLNEQNLNNQIAALYLDEESIGAISTFDYLHTDENQATYQQNSVAFAEVIEDLLKQETFTLAIKRVLTANDNTTLRLKNINHELSPEFKQFSNPRPVVLGHGLFGSLFDLEINGLNPDEEGFGLRIAKDEAFDQEYIRDTWLIEYSGGPNTDCDLCPVYDYDDLINYYWPALIGGVLKYTNKTSVDYVGYSAGGGLGIKSYEKYYQGNSSTLGYYINDDGTWQSFNLPSNFVNHMGLIAPMGAFDGDTIFTDIVDDCGNDVIDELSGNDHPTRGEIVEAALQVCDLNLAITRGLNLLSGGNKVSIGFFDDIIQDVLNKNNSNPRLSSINELLVIRGGGSSLDDGVVPRQDVEYMFSNSNATQKFKAIVGWPHYFLPDKGGVYDPLTAKFLNDKNYNIFESGWYQINED